MPISGNSRLGVKNQKEIKDKILNLKVSVCLTVFNEEESIGDLLNSLLKQSKKPDEIVVIDGGSKDKTAQIIRHFQKKDKKIKLLVQKCTRAEGRNLSCELAKNEIIAITDADCTADSKWLRRVTDPFKHKEIDMVAGFYSMLAVTPFEKALSYFLAVTPKRFSSDFLPSTRSVAFRKSLWERVGGFPEDSNNSAEDTDFNYEVVKIGAGIARTKDAIVFWKIPTDLKLALNKFYNYAKWDAKKMILWHPTQKFRSHNIKALLKFFRYGIFFLTLFYASQNIMFLGIFILEISLYFYWIYRKLYYEYENFKTSLWGIPIHIMNDVGVMLGFISGLIS